MNTLEIEAIFFDMGGTLRLRVPDEELQRYSVERLMSLLGVEEKEETLFARMTEGYRAYHRWAQQTLIELSEKEIWTRWMLPDFPREQVEPLAEELTMLWRNRSGRAVYRSDAKPVIVELRQRGYRLGLVSNTISSRDTPGSLDENGLTQYFSAMILSSTSGRRKPDPELLLQAARRTGVSPSHCAYVGDRPTRDAVSSRQAGFAMTIIIENPEHPDEKIDPQFKPDAVIHRLSDLLDIFPPR